MYENMNRAEETRIYPYEGGIEFEEIFPYTEQSRGPMPEEMFGLEREIRGF
jgi:hypothetical protein